VTRLAVSVHRMKLLITFFFRCLVAKVSWGVAAKCLNTNYIRGNIDQCFVWLHCHLKIDKITHVVLIYAICWATWKARNKMCFDEILVKSPNEIICHIGALILS
jgi:hypothetical protein